jgi:hypothetical protein
MIDLVAKTIIPGQQGTYRHLTARVSALIADSGLSSGRVEQYFGERRAAGYLGSRSPGSVAVPLELLHAEGVLAAEQPSPPCSASEALLASFQD